MPRPHPIDPKPTLPSPTDIRAQRAERPTLRARDFADAMGIPEAALVAAHLGHGVTALTANPDRLIPMVQTLGDVLALTRNASCVQERRGTYNGYRGGPHAAMVLDAEIDMRIFPDHWVHAFAVTEATDSGTRRSLQIFDAAGDAVHKVHLKPESDVAAFDRGVAALRSPAQVAPDRYAPAPLPEGARVNAAAAAALRADWSRMTDTHQFLKLVKSHKMNRLGAYRVVGAPHAVPLHPEAVAQTLRHAADDAIPVMIFVGNAGCIQIHGGPIRNVVPMGPWINVMDPRYNLHLRQDHVAEVWLVTKPTRTGDAISVEGFDANGQLILQIFGYRKDTPADAWNQMVQTLPRLPMGVR